VSDDKTDRHSPLDMSGDEFRAAGHALVDTLADWLEGLPGRPVTPNQAPVELRAKLPPGALPEQGRPAAELLAETAPLLLDNSLYNGHPRFFGYITSSAAPIGALADLLAASVNPNLGGWELSPMATEIEKQALTWIAQLLRYPEDAGGIFVSGGNAANFHAFLAARAAKCPWDARVEGLRAGSGAMLAYATEETHTWLQKATDLFGHGTGAVRIIPVGQDLRADPAGLREQVRKDRAAGDHPFLIVATTGTVSTGVVDPLRELAEVARDEGLWLHADGAYGAFAACLNDAPADLHALSEADSVACDPHKWLYSPIEAGVALIKDPEALERAFAYMPKYYHFESEETDPRINFYARGLQNTRGFRALKTWLGLRQAGREGIRATIAEDCRLTRRMYQAFEAHSEIEAKSCALSIATCRYRPSDFEGDDTALDELNDALLTSLKRSGETFLSNAVIDERTYLRACIVNFRTTEADVDALPEIIVRHGRACLAESRSSGRS
jgi:glutamate/tyrosine decarboxylase-like PLP-dependent enzyme